MKILGVETSCDETAAAVVWDGVAVLSSVVSSSVLLHTQYGGIIPEIAAREQIKVIIPVIEETINRADIKIQDLDALAVTSGPGLVGSLLVGVETVKTLGLIFNKPIVPINHLHGHIYANFLTDSNLGSKINTHWPKLALIVSGGHTDLVLISGHGRYKWLGGTRDDAAGEAFDKVARLLGLPYPGGPEIERVAKNGDPDRFSLPRPMKNTLDFDFSFSGLKTAVVNLVNSISNKPLAADQINDLAASFQQAVVDVLVAKTIKAAKKYQIKQILLGGGVAANSELRGQISSSAKKMGVEVLSPAIEYCVDNGAMIASAAYFNFKPIPYQKINSQPGLYL
jgi:N6-L-threonylcarbamoyladenine synthase